MLVYSSALLNEANNLVEIEPSQAKQMANSYLTLRVLSDQREKSPSAISREETDFLIRTPNSSIDAYKIQPSAEYNLAICVLRFNTSTSLRAEGKNP